MYVTCGMMWKDVRSDGLDGEVLLPEVHARSDLELKVLDRRPLRLGELSDIFLNLLDILDSLLRHS